MRHKCFLAVTSEHNGCQASHPIFSAPEKVVNMSLAEPRVAPPALPPPPPSHKQRTRAEQPGETQAEASTVAARVRTPWVDIHIILKSTSRISSVIYLQSILTYKFC